MLKLDPAIIEACCRDVVPPHAEARVSVPQVQRLCHQSGRLRGHGGSIIGMVTFGESSSLKGLLIKFGFTPEKVIEAVLHQIERNTAS